MAVTGVGVTVQENEPSAAPDGSNHIYSAWLKVSTQQWYVNVNWIWVEVSDIPEYAPLVHSHPTHGDINFIGTLSVASEQGINTSGEGEYEVGQIESIKVRNGVIVALTEK